MVTTQKPRVRVRANTDATRLVGSLAAALKSLPDDKIEDLKDAVDIDAPVGGDLWNNGGRNPTAAEIITGESQAASGDGASRMVRVYSDATTEQGGIARMYADFAETVEGMKAEFRKGLAQLAAEHQKAVTQMTAEKHIMQKGLEALAGAYADLLGVSKDALMQHRKAAPQAAAGPVQREPTTEDDQDQDDVEKSARVQNLDLPGFLRAMAPQAANLRNATPPDLSGAVQKATTFDTYDDGYNTYAAIANDTLRMRREMVAAGLAPESILKAPV